MMREDFRAFVKSDSEEENQPGGAPPNGFLVNLRQQSPTNNPWTPMDTDQTPKTSRTHLRLAAASSARGRARAVFFS
jgi:hypothetical protein